jgi:hypothetical protein
MDKSKNSEILKKDLAPWSLLVLLVLFVASWGCISSKRRKINDLEGSGSGLIWGAIS